jgi:hypothetical protein
MGILALITGRPSTLGRMQVLISVRGRIDPRAIVLLEGFGIFFIFYVTLPPGIMPIAVSNKYIRNRKIQLLNRESNHDLSAVE